MNPTEGGSEDGGRWQAWLVVLVLVASLLAWGFFLYFAVGDKGPPPWDFDVVDDLPGSSPYSTHGFRSAPILGTAPVRGARPVVPQHVGARDGS